MNVCPGSSLSISQARPTLVEAGRRPGGTCPCAGAAGPPTSGRSGHRSSGDRFDRVLDAHRRPRAARPRASSRTRGGGPAARPPGPRGDLVEQGQHVLGAHHRHGHLVVQRDAVQPVAVIGSRTRPYPGRRSGPASARAAPPAPARGGRAASAAARSRPTCRGGPGDEADTEREASREGTVVRLDGVRRRLSADPGRRSYAYSEAMTVRVVFADDNYLVREGVAGLLTEADGVDLLETVADPEALLRVAEHRPDAVLTDIRMPPTFTTEGIDAAKRIRGAPRDRGGGLAVRRGGVRVRAARRRGGGAGLPAQGARQRSTTSSAPCTTCPAAVRARPKVVEGLLTRKGRGQLGPERTHRP